MKRDGKKRLTSEATNLDVVVLAVHVLGGSSHAVDTEDVAVQTNELAPGMFAWRKYPDQINLELVRVTLSEAKKPKNGALLSGSGRKGWRLSLAGVEWIRSRGLDLLAEHLCWDQSRRTAGSIDVVRKERELRRLRSSDVWRKWYEGTEISPGEARWVFRVDSFSSPDQIQRKTERLQSLFVGDEEPTQFLSYVREVLEHGGQG